MEITSIGSAADKLASVIRDTAGIIIDPLKKITLSEADLIIEKRKAIKQLEIDKINVFNRTTLRLYETEIQRQLNLETIFQETLSILNPSSKPENLNKDWLNYFISTSQDVSEDNLKKLWSKILAEECIIPNSFSKLTLEKLKVMSANDCKLFEKLCSRVVETHNNLIIIKIDKKINFEKAYNFKFVDFIHLCDLGLLNNSEIANISIPSNSYLEVLTPEGSKKYIVNESKIEFQIKFYLLTTAGKELNRILNLKSELKYFENLKDSLKINNIFIKDNYSSYNTFLYDNVD